MTQNDKQGGKGRFSAQKLGIVVRGMLMPVLPRLRFWNRQRGLSIGRKRHTLRRALVSALAAAGGLALAGLVVLALLMARLAEGPLALDLAPRIVAALDQRFGGAYQFALAGTSITRGEQGVMLDLTGVSVRDASGKAIIAAPLAQLTVEPWPLLLGQLVPQQLDVIGIDLRLSVLPDGGFAISAGSAGVAAIALSEAVPLLPQAPGEAVQGEASVAPGTQRAVAAIRAFLDAATRADSPLGALDRLSVKRGRLLVDDQVLHHLVTFEGVDLALHKQAGSARMQLGADGPNGRWSATALAQASADAAQSLDIEIKDISFDELALLAGWGQPGFSFDMPISSRFKIAFDGQGKLAGAGGRIVVGAGLFKLDDRDHEPMMIDEISADVRIDPFSGSVLVEKLQIDAGETHFEADGQVVPPKDANDGWHLAMATRPDGLIGPERPGEKAIILKSVVFSGQFLQTMRQVTIDSFTLDGASLHLDLSGLVQWGAAPRLSLAMASHDSDVQDFARLMPSFVAAPARAWILQHVTGGKIDSGAMALDFDAAAFDLLAHDHVVHDGALHLEVTLSDVSAVLLPGLAPVSGLDGTILASGRKFSFRSQHGVVDAGNGRRLALSEGSFTIADTDAKPPLANIGVRMTGGLDAVTHLLAAESLKPFASLPPDVAGIKGQIDGRMSLDLKLTRPATPEDTQFRVNAIITNFAVEKLIGKERLESATLSLLADRSGMRATGAGRMFGAPATIELKRTGKDKSEAVIGVTLDDAARARQGYAIPGLTGPVSARIVASPGEGADLNASVELDLTKAALDGTVPGFAKPAGRAAKATFQLVSDEAGTVLEQIAFDSGVGNFRGSAKFGAEGSFISAKINQLRLSPGDEMRVEVAKAGDGLKLVMRGTMFDGRPYLQALINPAPDASKEPGRDVEIDFKSGTVNGANRQSLSAVDLKFSRKGGLIRHFQVFGRFGAAQLAGNLVGQGQVNVHSDNAGAFLAFADFYRRMEGGTIDLSLNMAAGRTDGQVLIHDFLLRDEPALRRLVTEGTNVREDRNGTIDAKFDATAVEFNKLQASFSKTGGRIEVRDGFMHGPQIGTSLEGAVDFAKNFIDVKGTFVPAYALNNFFARIPVLGLLLGGSSHEGLFAVNFRISGPASAPTLNINPLSAIAPGFLRKIFGSGDIPSAFQPQGGAVR